MKNFILCTTILTVIGIPFGLARADIIPIVYHRDLSEDLLDSVSTNFTGNGHLDEMSPELFTNDPNLHLSTDSIVSLTFLDENAGYHSSLGYFTFDDNGQILEKGIVFSDFSEVGGGGTLTAGDTIDIGEFSAGTNLGFYIIPSGNRTPHYTLDSLNPNQDNYTAFYTHESSGYGVLGFEDQKDKPSWGTAYNDAIVGVSVSSVPEPATIALLALGSSALIYRKSIKKNKNEKFKSTN